MERCRGFNAASRKGPCPAPARGSCRQRYRAAVRMSLLLRELTGCYLWSSGGASAMISRRGVIAGLSASGAFPSIARAAWPERPITMLHGLLPGGGADANARIAADGLGKLLGQPVIVESKPGAGTTLASAQLVRAAPDGHTIALLAPHIRRQPHSTRTCLTARSRISARSACYPRPRMSSSPMRSIRPNRCSSCSTWHASRAAASPMARLALARAHT